MISRFLFLAFLMSALMACQSDAKKKKRMVSAPINSISWELDGEKMQLSKMGGSFGESEKGNRLVIFSTDGKQGLVLTIAGDSTGYVGKHPFIGRRQQIEPGSKDCWARFNKKIANNDVSFMSKFCKPTDGFIEITHFDDKEQVVSGTFRGTLCPVGSDTENIAPVTIENGIFHELRIARLQ